MIILWEVIWDDYEYTEWSESTIFVRTFTQCMFFKLSAILIIVDRDLVIYALNRESTVQMFCVKTMR